MAKFHTVANIAWAWGSGDEREITIDGRTFIAKADKKVFGARAWTVVEKDEDGNGVWSAPKALTTPLDVKRAIVARLNGVDREEVADRLRTMHVDQRITLEGGMSVAKMAYYFARKTGRRYEVRKVEGGYQVERVA